MPKLKQPESLEMTALGVLNKIVLRYFNELSKRGAVEELRQGVAIIQKHVCSYMPRLLLAEFLDKFVHDFVSHEPPLSHKKVAMEILMDIDIVGLRCKGRSWGLYDFNNVNRLKRLEELDLQCFSDYSPYDLENFSLRELTTFIFAQKCTDSHLEVIGQNCSMLQVLKVPDSLVTDEGLRNLSSCSELRVVDVYDCPVSYDGINSLLSVNRKVEDLAHWDSSDHQRGFRFTFQSAPSSENRLRKKMLNSSVCPSMSRFVFTNDRDIKLLELKTVVAKFSNLTCLVMKLKITENLSVLKSLNKLSGIEIKFESEIYYDEIEQTWAILKELLTFIGTNITTLKLSCWDHGFFWYQSELDFIFDSCPNLECFGFDQGNGTVLIPSFQKLKELTPRIPIEFEQIEILDDPGLQFGVLPSLETLSVLNYGMNVNSLESIMLDDIKFPNLSVIETNCLKAEELERLEQIAKNKNLDIKIKNDTESNWYIEYRFGDGSNSDDD